MEEDNMMMSNLRRPLYLIYYENVFGQIPHGISAKAIAGNCKWRTTFRSCLDM
jgi:hypothetical protein